MEQRNPPAVFLNANQMKRVEREREGAEVAECF